ncbi:MAG: CBS domain-containing protein [Gemmataceae bacterium]|nr:CBS domain-containing protein [Gemmataceae bacterium]
MLTATKPLMSLTANDLMTSNVVMIPREMSLRKAAQLLSQHQISGAPVVDAEGRCIGVVSATDFIHWAQKDKDRPRTAAATADCHCAWQVIEPEELPLDQVGTYMTADPVMTPANTPIGTLARMMLDAHIHRVIVRDERRRPIGIVSSTDVLAAVAHAEPPRRHEP